MFYWLLVIPVLGILILVHELGHFCTARWVGVRVEEFGMGYPPRLLKLGERNGVVYSLNWIPAGGFVRLAGEEDPAVKGGLAGKKPWQRIVVLASGSLMNLALTFVLFSGMFLLPHEVGEEGRIGLLGILPGSPAERAGLRAGDVLLEIDDQPVEGKKLFADLNLKAGRRTTVTVERQGEERRLEAIPTVEPIRVYELGSMGMSLYFPGPAGAVLTEVLPSRPAWHAGLRKGDRILSLDGRPLQDEQMLGELTLNRGRETTLLEAFLYRLGQAVWEQVYGDTTVALEVERDGQLFVASILPQVGSVQVLELDYLGVETYFPEYRGVVLQEVKLGRPAYEAGLREGDLVLALDGQIVRDNLDFILRLHNLRQVGAPLELLVGRASLSTPLLKTTVLPPPPDVEDQKIGITLWQPTRHVQLGLGEALGKGARETLWAVMLVPRTLSTIVHSPARVQEMAGPVGIAQVTGQVARSNQLEGIVYLVAMLSANLFAVNLLPMPALDGGRIAFVLLEWLRGGRRIPHRWETLIHLVGMVLALGLLAAVTVFDVLRLANGGP